MVSGRATCGREITKVNLSGRALGVDCAERFFRGSGEYVSCSMSARLRDWQTHEHPHGLRHPWTRPVRRWETIQKKRWPINDSPILGGTVPTRTRVDDHLTTREYSEDKEKGLLCDLHFGVEMPGRALHCNWRTVSANSPPTELTYGILTTAPASKRLEFKHGSGTAK